MANEDIRYAAGAAGVKLWQIASALGMRDCNLSRKLRDELSQDEKEKLFTIIRQLSGEDTETQNTMKRFVGRAEKCYQTIDMAVSNEDFHDRMLEAARFEMLAFRAKYQGLNELSIIIDEIDNILNE